MNEDDLAEAIRLAIAAALLLGLLFSMLLEGTLR